MSETITFYRVDANGLLHSGPHQKPAGEFLTRNETETPPPEAGENQVAKYDMNAGRWDIVHDYRGTTYYTSNGQPTTISRVGIQPPADAIMEAPETQFHNKYDYTGKQWLLDRDTLRSYLHDVLEAEKRRAQLGGVLIDGVRWDSDDKAEIRYTQFMVIFQANPSHTIPSFRPNKETSIELTAAMFNGLYTALQHQVGGIFTWLEAKEKAVAAADTDDGLLDILANTQYPALEYNADGTVKGPISE